MNHLRSRWARCPLPISRLFRCVRRWRRRRAIEFSRREGLIAERLRREVVERLEFLDSVGLSYLSLDRNAASLSGGEGQRIRLATQIGSRLRGVLYVLDEPSIGLHQRDNQRLIEALKSLRDLGNTVLVVEHDEDTIRHADYVVDLGPGAGKLGGHVVAAGTPQEIMETDISLTGRYLSGDLQTISREAPRDLKGNWITVEGAGGHNLKNLTVQFPLNVMTVVTGVSGSGKSTLVNDTLYRALARELYGSRELPEPHKAIKGFENIDKAVRIDQSPIGRTPRSNPATYTGVFTAIRDLFARLPESRERGYKPGRFSFNVSGGRCEACQGEGQRRIEMNFLPDVYVLCEVCNGRRYNQETLAVKFNGYSIADLLELAIEDALPVLIDIPQVRQKLETLVDVGFGYIHLGQAATTLSGGEAQRMKLARELSKRQTGKTLYLLDEPTTGLHFDDVRRLLEVLHRLTDLGNTVIIIEHNLDVIRSADWILDLGPEGGEGGGNLVAKGTPAEVAATLGSYTGEFLRRYFPPQELKPFAATASGTNGNHVSAQACGKIGSPPLSNDLEILSSPEVPNGLRHRPRRARPDPKLWSHGSVLHRGHHRPAAHQCFCFRAGDGFASAGQGDAGATAPRAAPAYPHHGRLLTSSPAPSSGQSLPTCGSNRSPGPCIGTSPRCAVAGRACWRAAFFEPRRAVPIEFPSHSQDAAD